MTGPPTSKPTCAGCGAQVPPDAPQGYCMNCLFALGTAAPDSVVSESAPQLETSTLRSTATEDGRNPELGTPPFRSFGDYELLEEIARGGMGVVYKARQKSLGRIVAVKMLLFGSQSGKELAQRFRAEAAAAASLQHPNIVAIHEVSALEGQPFFVMDFIEGQSLAKLNAECEARNAEWLRRAARYVKIVAEAIHYAHERGILHRDLKPSNVLIDPFDQPRVTDFGLAKRIGGSRDESRGSRARDASADSDSGSRLSTFDSRLELTLSGQVLGSPNYMPPEQAAAKRGLVGRRSDVYSLGAILYHLLTGRPPFVGETLTDTLQDVVNKEPVSPRLLNPSVPPDLETLCLKCLEKEPARRYQTAQALAEDLDRFLRDESIQARPVGPAEKLWRWCRRKPLVASLGAATLVLLLAVAIGSPIAIYRINHEWQRAEKGELAARQGELDARQKAYASDMNRVQQELAQNNLGLAQELLDRHRPAAHPLRSSRREEAHFQLGTRNSELGTSQSLLTSAATDLRGWEWRYLWQQGQGEERFILGEHTNGVTAMGLLADGKTVFSAGKDKCVRLWDLESRRQIGLLPHAEEVIGAAASSDGRWLATASMKGFEGQPVLLWDLATQKIAATLTTEFWLRPGSITFSPDNQWLAFATVFGGIRLWDAKTRGEITNLPAKKGASPGPLGVAFSPDSRTLAFNENEYGAILLWDVASHLVSRLAGHQSAVTALAFSPDGQTLASGSQDRTVKVWNLADRRQVIEFTNHSGGFTRLLFSLDSRTLAMSGEGGAGRVIRLVDVETGRQKAELRGHLRDISSLAFTSDGQTLLSASDDGTVRVWDPVPREKEKAALHRFAPNSISVAWRSYGPALRLSPDGRHLLSVYTNQTFSLWDTLRLAEGERHPLAFTDTTFAAVAPGGGLAAFGSRGGEVMLWHEDTEQARFFARPGTNRIHLLVFSPDGRHLAAADDAKTLAQMGVADDTRRTVRVWDVDTRMETHVFSTGDGEFPVSLIFSADAKALVAGFSTGPVKRWPLDGTAEATAFHGHSGWVWGLAMLTNGQTLISAGPDIRFWDVRTRHENALKLSPSAGANRISLSSDGRRLAAGADDGRITIWDLASHQKVATLEGHQEPVTQLAFTPDGNHLVSASKDQLRVWHASSWAEIEAAEKKSQRDDRK